MHFLSFRGGYISVVSLSFPHHMVLHSIARKVAYFLLSSFCASCERFYSFHSCPSTHNETTSIVWTKHVTLLAIVSKRMSTVASLRCDGLAITNESKTLSQKRNHLFIESEHRRNLNQKKTTICSIFIRPRSGGKPSTSQVSHAMLISTCLQSPLAHIVFFILALSKTPHISLYLTYIGCISSHTLELNFTLLVKKKRHLVGNPCSRGIYERFLTSEVNIRKI